MEAIQRAMESLAEVVSKHKLLEILDQARLYSSSPQMSRYAERAKNDLLESVNETPESVQKVRQKLINSLLDLSDEESKEFLEMFKGSEYEKFLNYNLQANDVLFKDRLIIFCKMFQDFDLTGMVDGFLKMLREREIPYTSIAEKQEIDARKKKGLDVVNGLKKCMKEMQLSPKIVGLVFDAMTRDDPEYTEELSSLFSEMISNSDNINEVENIALLWHKVASDQAERILNKVFHSPSSSSLAKGNAQKALIHIGKPMSSTENIILSGDFKGAFVPIKSNFSSEVSVIINNNKSIDDETKKHLERLISELQSELNKAPQDKTDEAVAVAETTKNLVEIATKEKVNKPLVTMTAETLKKAAENIGAVLPAIIPIVLKIIELLNP